MSKFIKYFNTHTDYNNYIKDNEISPVVCYCDDNEDVHYGNDIDYSLNYFTTVALEDGTISFNIGKPINTTLLQSIGYSTDNGETWTIISNQNDKSENLVISVNVNEGDKILWKGQAKALSDLDKDGVCYFSSNCLFDVEGNIMSLLYSDKFENETELLYNYAFSNLFYDFYHDNLVMVVNAKNLILPATTLSDTCYGGMFTYCTNLVTAPELPATTLVDGCYSGMFEGCTSLITAPELPATTLAVCCYEYMFQECTNLVTAPELPATTLTDSCYSHMFYDCTSLTMAPELPATILADGCYDDMFYSCTGLTTAPELPATILANNCYNGMFAYTNVLPDTTNIDFTSQSVVASGGLKGLFAGTKITDNDLNNILPKNNNNNKYCLPVTILSDLCYIGMFSECTSLTTAPELPATTLAEYCYAYMFEACTSLTTAPSILPATILAEYCYEEMFSRCISLTTAPELPATTLVNGCYYEMFWGCTNLNYIKAMFTTTPSTSYTNNWVNGVASTGTFVKNSAATWSGTGTNSVPTGWTVETASF